jgi:hypothetical protein
MQNNIFINWFDIYGKEFNINVSGNQKVKTLEGSIIGFISIFAIASFCLFQLIEVLKKDVVSVIYNESLTKIPINNLTDIPMMFKVVDALAKYVPPQGLYSFDSFYFNYQVGNDSQNKSIGFTKILPIKVEPCDRDRHLGPYKNLFEKIDVENYHCIPREKYNLTIYGRYGDIINGFSELDIYISKCINSTTNTNDTCLDEETISKKTTGLFLIFAHVSNQIDHYNYTKPNQLKVQTVSLTFTYYILKRYIYSLMPMTYETDFGFLFEEKYKENFFIVKSITWDIDPKPAQIINKKPQLTSLHLFNTEATGSYSRSYVKFSNIIASVGGVIKFILFFCEILNYFITQNVAFEKVINLIFKEDPIDDLKLTNKNFMERFKIPKAQEVSKFSRINHEKR